MGSFFITNDVRRNNISLSLYKKADFKNKHSIGGQNYFVNIYQKKLIRDKNCISFKNGDFVAATGTLIYKGQMGRKSLENIHRNFNDITSIKRIRHGAIGHYALVVKKRDLVWVFGDKCNLYKIFYYNVRRKYLDFCRNITNEFIEEIKEYFNLKIPEKVEWRE